MTWRIETFRYPDGDGFERAMHDAINDVTGESVSLQWSDFDPAGDPLPEHARKLELLGWPNRRMGGWRAAEVDALFVETVAIRAVDEVMA